MKQEGTGTRLPLFCFTGFIVLPSNRMLLIDGMHNLYLGTAKHFARDIWMRKNYLDPDKLTKIEERLKNSIVPAGLGRLPSSISLGQFLTADQWKNWTIYFSVYCLVDLLPKPHLEEIRDGM